MAVTVWHIRMDVTVEERLSVTLPFGNNKRPVAAAALFASGGYERVATVDTDDMERAWVLTQNGAYSPSWSRLPPKGVTPLEPSSFEVDGERLGRKSSEVGDIFEKDGAFHVVDTLGFAALGELAPAA